MAGQFELKKCVGNFAGIDLQDECGESAWANFTPEGPDWEMVRGGDGEKTVNRLYNDGGVMEITCSESSGLNKKLGLLMTAAKLGEKVAGPLFIRDPSGGATFEATQALIEGRPSWGRNPRVGEVVWRFLCPKARVVYAGHDEVGAI